MGILSKLLGSSASKKDKTPATPTPPRTGYTGDRTSLGARHGWGRFVFASGDVYEGEWVENQKHGYGEAAYTSGSSYRGQWSSDAKAGLGIFSFGHDGSSYAGHWIDDRKHGYGVAAFRTGNRYAGSWVADAMQGTGRFVYASGDAYDGEWVRNRKTGNGRWTSADGAQTYAGGWLDDLRHGNGVLVEADGVLRSVVYDRGELLSSTPAPPGTASPTVVDRSVPVQPEIPTHPRAPEVGVLCGIAQTAALLGTSLSPKKGTPPPLTAAMGSPSATFSSPSVGATAPSSSLSTSHRSVPPIAPPPAPIPAASAVQADDDASLAKKFTLPSYPPPPPPDGGSGMSFYATSQLVPANEARSLWTSSRRSDSRSDSPSSGSLPSLERSSPATPDPSKGVVGTHGMPRDLTVEDVDDDDHVAPAAILSPKSLSTSFSRAWFSRTGSAGSSDSARAGQVLEELPV